MSSAIDLSPVLERGKDFEYLVTTHDPTFNKLVDATEIVKKFIIDNKLIIYGGTAIDYALRLKGDKIYPDDMLTVPDLDFYSPKNVEHAYQLADILYTSGYKEARAINAQHMETMRVDLVDNHFIADITYRPQDIFDKLPYLEYNGMRVIHPDFQRIDVHSSLSFPYDNPPREVIFERWSKDIKRFNKLAALYPVCQSAEGLPLREVTVENTRKYVLTGFAAYAVIYQEFLRGVGSTNVPKLVIPAKFSLSGDKITFDTFDQRCEIVHFNPKKAADELELMKLKRFEPYINLLPERFEGDYSGKPFIIYSTRYRLISINSVEVNKVHVRITNIQFLLKHFLSMYFAQKDSPKTAAMYLSRYISLLAMISVLDSKSATPELLSILSPSVQPYGSENINLAREVALSRLYHELEDAPLLKIPQNYYPARSAARGMGPPPFNIDDIEFFHESGKEIPL